MEFRDQARHGLIFARRMTEGLLQGFHSREDWLLQVHPKTHHAMWIVGHLALVDNSFINRFRSDAAHRPEGWDKLFGFGSQLSDDGGVYPPEADALTYFRERRETLLRVLDQLTPEELSAPAPPAGERGPLAGAPSIGFGFVFLPIHEGMHAGQLTVVHRALGHPPLLG